MKLFKLFKTDKSNSKSKKRSTLESQRMSIHSYQSDQSESSGLGPAQARPLHSDWPLFELQDLDFIDYEDNVSISSLDMSIWKTAPTDNEAPPIISQKELEKHRTNIDAWIALKGMVYDVTTFLDVHPGGYKELWKGVGRNATNLFMKVHPAVEIRKYLGKQCVGVYIPNPSEMSHVPSKPIINADQQPLLLPPQTQTKNSKCGCKWNFFRKGANTEDPEGHFQLRFTQNELLIVLEVKAPPALDDHNLDADSWNFVIWDNQMLFIQVVWSPVKCWTAQYRLDQELDKECLFVSFREHNTAVVMIPKDLNQENWKRFGVPESRRSNCIVQDPAECDFDDSTRALLFYRKQITQRVVLYGFKLRPSSYFGVPVGYTLILTVGEMATRIFPTTFTLMGIQEPICDIKGQTFYFLLPQEHGVSYELNSFKSMNEKEMMEATFICIGSPLGDFQWKHIVMNVDTLVLLVSGIGIAPITRILHHFRDQHPEHLKKTHVLLLYFNRTKADIIWYNELVQANATYPWFHLFLIVEEPDSSWDELIGSISTHLVKWCLRAIPSVCSDELLVNALASGDRKFLDSCQRIFQNMQDYFDNVAVCEPYVTVAPRPRT